MAILVRVFFVAGALGVIGIVLSAVVRVLRSDLDRRWPYVLLAVLAVFRVTLVWQTGEVAVNWFHLSILGLGVRSVDHLGLIVSLSLPAGALLAHQRISTLRKEHGNDLPSSNGESGATVEADAD